MLEARDSGFRARARGVGFEVRGASPRPARLWSLGCGGSYSAHVESATRVPRTTAGASGDVRRSISVCADSRIASCRTYLAGHGLGGADHSFQCRGGGSAVRASGLSAFDYPWLPGAEDVVRTDDPRVDADVDVEARGSERDSRGTGAVCLGLAVWAGSSASACRPGANAKFAIDALVDRGGSRVAPPCSLH